MEASSSPSSPRIPAGPAPGNSRLGVSASLFPPSAFLRRYFSSGWAFLVPYLLTYLLYYWRKWPVNAGVAGLTPPHSRVPPLLHVYWAFHAINLLLAFLAFQAWRRKRAQFSLSAILPWALLALLFYIPGAYLEFPSDPWEHLRRINEWSSVLQVGSYYIWFRSSYFLAYSLLGRIPASWELFWLDFYYTGACMLLCWQYFRLAVCVGLEKRPAVIFVLLQALFMGNVVFSFYRYYGVSTTVFAQIGAVALTRAGLEFAKRKTDFTLFRVSMLLFSAICLLLLIAFNHVQGIGIVAMGLAAVAVWRLIKWRRSMILVLGATALILSAAAIRWLPRPPALDQVYRPFGVLTPWYGFNLFSFHTLAGDRTLQILGLFGVINLIAALPLLRWNDVTGWLTIMPILALCLPFVAIPYAGIFAHQDYSQDIILFHRIFFAIPAGLAIVVLGSRFWQRRGAIMAASLPGKVLRALPCDISAFSLVCIGLLALTVVPASASYYNRMWNALSKVPDDLCMRRVWASYSHLDIRPKSTLLVATTGMSWPRIAQYPYPVLFTERLAWAPADNLSAIQLKLADSGARNHLVVAAPQFSVLCTPYSFSALCSGHWLPQEVGLSFAGANELRAMSVRYGLVPLPSRDASITYFTSLK